MRWYELLEAARRRLAYAIAGPQLMALNRRCEILMGAITQVQDRNDELQQQIDNITEDVNNLPPIPTIDDVDKQVDIYLENMTAEEWANVLPELEVSDAVDAYFESNEGIDMLGDLIDESPTIAKRLEKLAEQALQEAQKRQYPTTTT